MLIGKSPSGGQDATVASIPSHHSRLDRADGSKTNLPRIKPAYPSFPKDELTWESYRGGTEFSD